MKKILSMFLVLSMLLGCSAAMAESSGILIIGSDSTVDNGFHNTMELNGVYTINGYALLSPRRFVTADFYAQFDKDSDYSYKVVNWIGEKIRVDAGIVFTYQYSEIKNSTTYYCYCPSASWIDSGDSADFIMLFTDITNTDSRVDDLTSKITVKAVYRDEFEYPGWIRQIDYDKISRQYTDGILTRYGYDSSLHPGEIIIHPDNEEKLGFMQTGSYILGCTLPNFILEDKDASLSLVIAIDENELIYSIRKGT